MRARTRSAPPRPDGRARNRRWAGRIPRTCGLCAASTSPARRRWPAPRRRGIGLGSFRAEVARRRPNAYLPVTLRPRPWHSRRRPIRFERNEKRRKTMAKTATKAATKSGTRDLFENEAAPRRLSAKAARAKPAPGDSGYTARDIEVLEGLEPVR